MRSFAGTTVALYWRHAPWSLATPRAAGLRRE